MPILPACWAKTSSDIDKMVEQFWNATVDQMGTDEEAVMKAVRDIRCFSATPLQDEFRKKLLGKIDTLTPRIAERFHVMIATAPDQDPVIAILQDELSGNELKGALHLYRTGVEL